MFGLFLLVFLVVGSLWAGVVVCSVFFCCVVFVCGVVCVFPVPAGVGLVASWRGVVGSCDSV